MAKELAAGFDLAAQVSQKSVESIFQSYYWLGNFPNYVSEAYQKGGKTETLEIFFDQPGMRFVSEPNLPNPIQLTFKYLVRMTSRDDEFDGEARLVLSADKQTVIDGDKEATVITVSFPAIADEAFNFKNSKNVPEFASVVKPVLLKSLLQTTEPLPITPPAAAGAGFFTARTYLEPLEKSFLGVFVNQDPIERAAPEDVSYPSIGDGVVIVIPKENVDKSIKAQLATMGLDDLPKTITVDGDDYTVNALTIKLKNGHLRVDGDIDDVEFKAWVSLMATADGLKPMVGKTEFDMPWWMDVADFFSAGVITRAIEESLPSALGSVSTTAVGELAVFGQSFPYSGVFVNVEPGGMVTIKSTGLLVPAKLTATVGDPVPVKKPTYIKGHKESKEFHRPGCVYGDKIKWKNAVFFVREAAAIHAGYNGCFTCAREYSHPAGRVIFGFQSAGHPPNVPLEISVRVEAHLVKPLVVDGVSVTDVPFAKVLKYKRKTNASGVWSAQDYDASRLFLPGTWRFRASSGSWVGQCEMKVRPTATNFGSTNMVAFTFGKPDGKFGYGEMPPFP